MATFGPIASAQPNVLFNPMAVDQAVQGRQRNQLMMDNARQDQQFQQQDRQTAAFDRDRTHVAQASAAILALPADQRPAAYAASVRDLQAQGIAMRAPPQYPGDQQLQALARQGMGVADQFKLDERQQGRAAIAGMFGSAPSATPGPAPVQGGAASASVPPELVPHFEEASRATGVPVPLLIAQAQQESGFRPDATGRSGEIGIMQVMPSTAQQPGFGMQGVDPATLRDPRANIMFGAQYLAARNQGTNWNDPAQRDAGLGRYNGGGDPNYAQNVARNLPGAAARTGGTDMAGPGASAAAAPGAGGPLEGLTPAQVATLRTMSAVPGANVQSLLAQAESMRQHNASTTRQTERDAATDARFTAQETRQDARAVRQERLDAEKAARPENATEAERKAGSYLERMQGAEELLQGMVRDGYNPGNVQDRAAGAIPFVGNFIATERGQRYLNAAAEWARAKLRLESGAVIGDEEAKTEARTYFPMPGDSPATIAQKQILRDNATSAIRRQAGRSAPPAPAARDGATPPMSSRDALTAARAKLGDGASDDDVVAEAVRLRGGH